MGAVKRDAFDQAEAERSRYAQISAEWSRFVGDYMRRNPDVQVAVTWCEWLNDRITFHVGASAPDGVQVIHVVRRA